MAALRFSKLIPGGNPTILLHDPELDGKSLGRMSGQLMDPMHIQAEQVGALYGPGAAGGLPHLEMMGGEFCVNAARCAALVLAGQGRLRALPFGGEGCAGAAAPDRQLCWGMLSVSGMPEPVQVLVCADAQMLQEAITGFFAVSPAFITKAEALPEVVFAAPPSLLHCAACVSCPSSATQWEALERGLHLVRMPGISHLLVDTSVHPLPSMDGPDWKKVSASLRRTAGLAFSCASGVVWYARQEEGYRIWPAVEVRAACSEHLESACGSASLALALHSYFLDLQKKGHTDAQTVRPKPVAVIQPSDETLLVCLSPLPPSSPPLSAEKTQPSLSAWISGKVLLVAQGTAYI